MRVPRCAAIYVRVSKDVTGERQSVKRQREDCRALARELGWAVGEVYEDNDVSAFSGKRRPEYRRLLDDLRSGLRDGVICWHHDRLHRSLVELEEYIVVCEDRSVDTVTVRAGPLDLATASGRTIARILGAVARGESERMGERMRRGNRQQAEQGKPRTNGGRGYGYERDGVTIREDEAAVIRSLVDRLLAGESLASLVRWLNDNDVPTVTGQGSWFSASMRAMLRRGRLSGQREYLGDIVAPGQWPAIITPAQTAAVRRLLDDPARKRLRTPSRYLLTGLIRCGRCERPMIAHPRKGVPGYDCRSDGGLGGCGRTSIIAEPLEELVRDMVLTALDGPDLASAMTRRHEANTDADVLADEIRADEARSQEVAVAFADGELTREQFRIANHRIIERLTQNRHQIATLNGHRDLARYVGKGDELTEAWETMLLDQRRAVIRAVVEKVTVGPGVRGRRTFDPDRAKVKWRV